MVVQKTLGVKFLNVRWTCIDVLINMLLTVLFEYRKYGKGNGKDIAVYEGI